MVQFMENIHSIIGRTDIIIVISAHWEESVATVLGSSNPVMFYDYYGFPKKKHITLPIQPRKPCTFIQSYSYS